MFSLKTLSQCACGANELTDLLNIRQRSRYNLRGNVGLVLQDPKATIELTSTTL